MSETWVLNLDLNSNEDDSTEGWGVNYDINFTITFHDYPDEGEITQIQCQLFSLYAANPYYELHIISEGTELILYSYDIEDNNPSEPAQRWSDGEGALWIRTLTFETAPTGELLTWLQANAVKQEDTSSKPKLLMSAGGGNSGETWVINEVPNVAINIAANIKYSFVYDGITYEANHFYISNDGGKGGSYITTGIGLSGSPDGQIYAINSIMVEFSGWLAESCRTLTFETAPTGDLLTWLQANAVKQSSASASKPCFTFINSKLTISLSTSTPNSSLGVLTNNGVMMNDGKVVVKGSNGWNAL